MAFPAFFTRVPRLTLRDPLAELLGAAEAGLIEYGYADAVRLAGHSCPTVAGAYLLAWRMLDRLYGGEIPERGGLRLEFRGDQGDGVAGVIAAVLGLLTGAAGEGGFKGLAGRYGRRGLLCFGVKALAGEVRMTRLDNGASCTASLDLSPLPGDPAIGAALGEILAGTADAAARARFADLWQGRVERLLTQYFEHPDMVRFA